MSTPRRILLGRIVFVVLAATAAGCFALFPLDDYGPGSAGADGGLDVAASSSSSSGSAMEASVDPNARRVFITSVATDGELATQAAGVDHLCQSLAADAGLPGSFKSWVSLPGAPVTARFFGDGGVPGVHYVDMQGRAIVPSWAQLFLSGHPEAAIEYDERGRRVSAAELEGGAGSCAASITPVWTDTSPDGGVTENGVGCNAFSSNGPNVNGRVGVVTSEAGAWTQSCALPCNLKAHLYCFEQ